MAEGKVAVCTGSGRPGGLGEAILSRLGNEGYRLVVTDVDGLDVTHVGLVERKGNQVNGLHAAPGHGVIRSPDLVRYGRSVNNVIGMSFFRPVGS